MRRLRHPARPELLESRTPLAAAHPAAPGAVAALIATLAPRQTTVLGGASHGTYSIARTSPDAIRYVQLTGTGTVQALGRVRVSGSVQETGLAGPGQQIGVLTLANARGHVTLRLEAQDQGNEATSTEHVPFVVQGGTGAYRQWTGDGSIALDFGPAAGTPRRQGAPAGPSVRGPFTLTIQPAPLVPGGGPVQPPPPSTTSGIRGTALEGPIAPVSRPGETDTRPLPGAIVTVQPAGGGPELARQQADATGSFQIDLAPGSYRIVPLPPQPGQPFPRGIPQDITVPPDRVIDLVVNYDTGIR